MGEQRHKKSRRLRDYFDALVLLLKRFKEEIKNTLIVLLFGLALVAELCLRVMQQISPIIDDATPRSLNFISLALCLLTVAMHCLCF